MTKEQQKNIVLVVILVAIIRVFITSRSDNSGSSGESDIASIAKGSDERKVVFCAKDSGVMPEAGKYTQYDRCIDYLKLVADCLVDPSVTPPPGSTPTTTAPAVPDDEVRSVRTLES